MENLKQLLQELQEMKKEIASLKNHFELRKPVPQESEWPAQVDINGAMEILGRSRSWINRRLKHAGQIPQNMNPNEYLVYLEDWHREGIKLIFSRDALFRLRAEFRKMGERYQIRKQTRKAA